MAEDGQLCQALLALKEPEGEHSGENQAEVFMKVVDDYQIRNKVGYFVMDNACKLKFYIC